MYRYEELEVVHLELTDKCNAACPQCPRNDHGGLLNPLLPMVELTLADINKIIPESFARRLKLVYICGNYGDAIVARETLEILQYLRRANEHIRLGLHTNGGARRTEWWTELGKLMPGGRGYVRFGIDGLEDTNHLYRRNTKWDVLMRNVKAFIQAGGNAEWDYIVFRHNEHQVEKARELARRLGFSGFNAIATGRFFDYLRLNPLDSTPVKDVNGNVEYRLERPQNPEWNNKALGAIEHIVAKYGSMPGYLDRATIRCKVASGRSIFVTADGYVLPCCWLGGRIHAPSKDAGDPLMKMIENTGGLAAINAKVYSIGEIVEGKLFRESIPQSWLKKSVAEGRLATCARVCGTEFDAYAAQRDHQIFSRATTEENAFRSYLSKNHERASARSNLFGRTLRRLNARLSNHERLQFVLPYLEYLTSIYQVWWFRKGYGPAPPKTGMTIRSLASSILKRRIWPRRVGRDQVSSRTVEELRQRIFNEHWQMLCHSTSNQPMISSERILEWLTDMRTYLKHQNLSVNRCNFRYLAKVLMMKSEAFADLEAKEMLHGFMQEQPEFIPGPKYKFSADFFSRNIPRWKETLGHLAGLPNLHFLELGSLEGYSACWLLENILTHETSRITCVDWFHSESIFDYNIQQAGVPHKVYKLKGRSQEVLRNQPLSCFDFIYVDADHKAPDVLECAILSWPLLKPGGLLIFDDYEFASHADPFLTPKIAIDAFLHIFQGRCRLLHKAYQVTIEKLSS